MIFVTVGTHEQQFNRLIQYMDNLKLSEPVFIQTGYSTYQPLNCQFKSMISQEEMVRYSSESDIVITHGGPGSIMLPLQYGKVPIVVPRQKQFDEHVNDHQVDFTKRLEADGKILAIYEIDKLGEMIANYKNLIQDNVKFQSHNREFNEAFAKMVDEL